MVSSSRLAILERTFAWEGRRRTGARDCQSFSQRTSVPNPAEFSHMGGEGRRGDSEPCPDQRLQTSRGGGKVWFPESSEETCFPPEFPAWTLPSACPSTPGPAKAVLLLLLFMPQKNSGQEKRQFVTELQGRGGSILQT